MIRRYDTGLDRPDEFELDEMDRERERDEDEYAVMLARDAWVERYSESLGWYE